MPLKRLWLTWLFPVKLQDCTFDAGEPIILTDAHRCASGTRINNNDGARDRLPDATRKLQRPPPRKTVDRRGRSRTHRVDESGQFEGQRLAVVHREPLVLNRRFLIRADNQSEPLDLPFSRIAAEIRPRLEYANAAEGLRGNPARRVRFRDR